MAMSEPLLMSQSFFKTEVQIEGARFQVILKPGFFLTRKEDTMWLHCHPDYEIHYVTAGAFEFRTEAERFSCGSGTVVVLPPKCYHTIDPMVEDSKKVSFEFSLAGSGQAWEDYHTAFGSLAGPWHMACQIPEFYEIGQLLRCEKNYEARFRLNATLGLALIRVAECLRGSRRELDMNIPLDSKKKDDADVMLSMLLNYIEHHAAGKLTLEQLSRDMNLSQRQIQRILREKMNDTFLSLLSRYRVMIAARAMGQEDRSLSRIAEEAGFSSYGAFCRSFQRYKGMSPDAYRQSMKKLP